MSVSAVVIADSIFEKNRLITLEIELHRFVLPEFNTHRSISRNFQSSRAVPVEKMIEQVRTDPALPVHWGKNQPGMVAKEELSGYNLIDVKGEWFQAAMNAADSAEFMNAEGCHKQVVNRLLEPFMWTKGVVTATFEAWQAFLKLRLHKDAQPEIKALAVKIAEAILASKSEEKKSGEWHLPYVHIVTDYYTARYAEYYDSIEQQVEYSLEDAIKISASCAGQVSYRKLDDSLEKALKIYNMLNLPTDGVYLDNPPHFSPTEHQVKFEHGSCKSLSGNFHKHGFIQYRKALEMGIEKELI